jgi:hypothetical protein
VKLYGNLISRGVKVFKAVAKTEELTEGWRKEHKEELRNLYSSPTLIGRSNEGS